MNTERWRGSASIEWCAAVVLVALVMAGLAARFGGVVVGPAPPVDPIGRIASPVGSDTGSASASPRPAAPSTPRGRAELPSWLPAPPREDGISEVHNFFLADPRRLVSTLTDQALDRSRRLILRAGEGVRVTARVGGALGVAFGEELLRGLASRARSLNRPPWVLAREAIRALRPPSVNDARGFLNELRAVRADVLVYLRRAAEADTEEEARVLAEEVGRALARGGLRLAEWRLTRVTVRKGREAVEDARSRRQPYAKP